MNANHGQRTARHPTARPASPARPRPSLPRDPTASAMPSRTDAAPSPVQTPARSARPATRIVASWRPARRHRHPRRWAASAPAPCRTWDTHRGRPAPLRDASDRCRSCRTAGAGAAWPSMYACGSAMNFSRQRAEQKYQVRPPASARCLAVCGFTFMPQTGSTAMLAAEDSWPAQQDFCVLMPGPPLR